MNQASKNGRINQMEKNLVSLFLFFCLVFATPVLADDQPVSMPDPDIPVPLPGPISTPIPIPIYIPIPTPKLEISASPFPTPTLTPIPVVTSPNPTLHQRVTIPKPGTPLMDSEEEPQKRLDNLRRQLKEPIQQARREQSLLESGLVLLASWFKGIFHFLM